MVLTKEKFVEDFKEHYFNIYSYDYQTGTSQQYYYVLGSLLRTYNSKLWQKAREYNVEQKTKQVFYFSMEFLPGRFLTNNLYNMGMIDVVKEGLEELELDYETIADSELEPAIGNGGLGRLASCFLDSGASLAIPLHGNGIRYHYGLFKQKFIDGYQVELPDNWLRDGNPWEIRNINGAVNVKLGGHVWMKDTGMRLEPVYENTMDILAVPYDTPSIGYNNAIVNNMRLWEAEILPEDEQNYTKAERNAVKEITENLYPDDSTEAGKRLRLIQEYFFVSAGVQSIIRQFKRYGIDRKYIPEKIAIQINDTHPALVIPELMRILLDEEKLTWNQAWQVTTNTVAYTNHTVLREAMETWPVDMVEEVVPRLYQIIKEIDERFSDETISIFGNHLTHSTRIIKDGLVHMAHLAIIGSYSVNGVASLHTDILKEDVLNDFYKMTPQKFNNKTNGITQRRFMHISNPGLTELISDKIGSSWKVNPSELKLFKGYITDSDTLERLDKVKQENKERLAKVVKDRAGVQLNTNAIFDVMIKRLHAYKRQHMQLLHIIDRYIHIKEGHDTNIQPRVFIFGAKAAPSYRFAKQIIKTINELADLVNNDPEVNDKLQVVFLENYNVSMAEKIIPAAEISEQISLAGKEASGTGNMKMMSNGALTVGTMDGANVEINTQVGDKNIFIFGLNRKEVDELDHSIYNPKREYEDNPRLKRVLDALIDGTIPNIKEEGKAIFEDLVQNGDEYYILKDFTSFVKIQEEVDQLYKNKENWNRKSLLNIASSGPFSSDYTVQRYANDIWQAVPIDQFRNKSVVSFDEPI